MCDVCLNSYCTSNCPNYTNKEAVYCSHCEDEIYINEKIYLIGKKIYCENCVVVSFLVF